MRRRMALALAALVVAAAGWWVPEASFSTPPVSLAQALSGKYATIQSVLDGRAEALLRGDRDAFLAALDSEAPGDFRRRQERLFDGFQRLPLVDYRLEASFGYFAELTSEREIGFYGAEARPTVLHVEERLRFDQFDRQPALDDLFLTFVRRDDGWKIVSDTSLDDLTLYSGRKMWEFGPIVTRESEHFLFVSHPELAGNADTVLAAAERALRRVEEVWPLPWRKRVMILAPSTEDELGRMIQAQFDLDVFVAFASSGLDRARDWDLVGHRIMLHWPNFSGHSDAVRQSILTHELLHIATRELSGPHVSAFVDEGIAEWVTPNPGTWLLAARVQSGSFDRRLPLDHEFITGDDADVLTAYQESYSLIRYAVEEYGPRAVADFYRRLGAPRQATGTWRYHVDRALRGAFGLGFEELQRRWADWVVSSYGG